MKKKILSVIVAIAILASAGYAINRFRGEPGGGDDVLAGEYRGGFLLMPDETDSMGVLSGSTFTLKSQTDYELAEVIGIFTIDGQQAPGIVLKEKNTFTITPKEPFEKNKLYTFKITRKADTDITWTFQTSAIFAVAGTLPADKTTNVPVDTGIEIYFSHSEYQNPDQYFEITPQVKGKFERHKNAYAFVPEKPLATGTLYTVTIKKGIKTTDGKTAIENDYVFGFETALDAKEQQNKYDKGYIFFNKVLNEYTTTEKPYLPVNYNFNAQNTGKSTSARYTVKATVYAYKQIDEFLGALDKKSNTPIWANYSYMSKSYVDTTGLSKALTFENEMLANPLTDADRYIKMPSNLPSGYYLVDCTWEDLRFQTFIQITDIGFYMTSDENSMLVWLNDLNTKTALANAKIELFGGNSTIWTTNEQGVSLFDYKDFEIFKKANDSGERYFKIVAADGRTAVLRRYMNDYSYNYKFAISDIFMPYTNSQGNDYWRYIQLDRSLYKPNDTVFFWGFVKNRYANEKIEKATAQISKGGYYPSYGRDSWSIFPVFTNEPVVKTTLNLSDGAFDGKLDLPYLEQGNYTLQIKVGDKVIASSSITVQNYTKPAYKIEIEKSKKAIFWYEPVEFTVKTAFFEGTKVPGLEVKYNFNSNFVNDISSGTAKTDDNGQFKTSIVPGVQRDAQGEVQANFTTRASLPESGEITATDSLRVFVNDLNVKIESRIIGTEQGQTRQGQVDFKINDIVLDRINNNTTQENYGDYLGAAVAGKVITGSIIKNRWIKYENGTYYDFINKKVTPRYDYKLTKETVATINAATDAKGEYRFLFAAPLISDGYYTYETTCVDKKARTMKFGGYIGEQWYYFNNDYIDYTRYYLDGVKEKYLDGSDVSLELKKGLETVPAAPILYIRSQNGIVDYFASAKTTYDFKITDVCKPNIYVRAVYFSGTTYLETYDVNIAYDYSQKEIMLNATTDKESYKPGEEVIIKINAQDKGGKRVKAIVNAGIVDEALFNLQDMKVSTLDSLYEFVPSGITASYASHINSGMDFGGSGVQYDGAVSATSKSASYATAQNGVALGANLDIAAPVREKFADTALFKTVILNENGEGEIKFTLPDNITSWRITLTGITIDLGAGSKTQTLKVTLPFFINDSFNSTYLAGDKASVGVTGYGNNLANGDLITYKVSTSSNPTDVKTATGKAFERINIPLNELTLADTYVLIEAQSGKGDKDAVKHYIDVKTSYHEIDESIYYDLVNGLKIEGGKDGNTKLIFMDKGRGMYYPTLQSYLWRAGNRIDTQISKIVAQEMLKTYFGTENSYLVNEPFKASDYQTAEGGIAILPYGPADLELSAKIATFVKGLIDEAKLTKYFQTVYENEKIGGLKAAALYGLASLRQPVLLEIGKAAKVNNASVKDLLYLCLAYCELGEQPQALKLYNEKLSPYIKQSGSLKWIDSGADKDDVLQTTALGLMLSVYIDTPTSESFYEYCKANSTNDILIDIEMLSFIKNKIVKANPTTGKFTYTHMGETKEVILESGKIEYRDIPSKNIGDFKIDSVTGDMALFSIFKKSPTGIETTDPNLKISRKYFDAKGTTGNTFSIDDVVKVELTVEFAAKAIDGNYEITDYIPSGLKPIENTWLYGNQRAFSNSWYGRINGQKISFNLYNYQNSTYNQEKTKKITYYARVVSAGTYTAESPIIQGDGNAAGMNSGERAVVVVR